MIVMLSGASVPPPEHEAEVAGLIYQLLARELAHKIKVSNTLISEAAV